jgi:hypothetical protein
VEGKSLRVFVSDMDGVAEVHLECITSPPEAVFDETGGELGTMQEVRCSDPDGVCAPFGYGRVAWC